jgi:hypothetical protein
MIHLFPDSLWGEPEKPKDEAVLKLKSLRLFPITSLAAELRLHDNVRCDDRQPNQ